MSVTPCLGCGVVLPDIPDGPTHAYMVSSTGCWAVTEWADTTWRAWSAHHALVRRWADEWRGKA